MSEIWARALKTLSQVCPGLKNFKINRFEARQISNLLGAPAGLGPARPLPLNFPSFNPLNDLRCRTQPGQFLSMQLPCSSYNRTLFFRSSVDNKGLSTSVTLLTGHCRILLKMTERTGSIQTPRRMLWPENQMHSANKIDFEDYTVLELQTVKCAVW